MEIRRKLEVVNDTFDLIGLNRKQFEDLLYSYEKQMYIWHNGEPKKGKSELLDKMKKIKGSDTLVI